jgi:hypothetical protein
VYRIGQDFHKGPIPFPYFKSPACASPSLKSRNLSSSAKIRILQDCTGGPGIHRLLTEPSQRRNILMFN